jgi:DNA-binding beta-propeller fold protein YncE
VKAVRETGGFSVVGEIGLNDGPIGGMAAARGGRCLTAISSGGDSVSVIDTRAQTVVATLSGTPEPSAIAIGRECACISTASATYDAITVLDLRAKRVAAVHPVAFAVNDVAVSPDADKVYCSATASGRADVAALDTMTGAGEIVAISDVPGSTTGSIQTSPDGRQLYVAVHGHSSDQLVLMDAPALRITGSVEIGSPIRDVAVRPDGDSVYVASCSPDFGTVLDVIDTRSGTVAATAKITGTGGVVTQLVSSADGQRAYLVDDHSVTVLSTLTLDIIGSVDVGVAPSCVVETAEGTRLCVADYAGVITVLSIPSTGVRDSAARDARSLLDRTPVMA